MTSALKTFTSRAFARPGVKKVYDELGEEFAFLDEVLRVRIRVVKDDQRQTTRSSSRPAANKTLPRSA